MQLQAASDLIHLSERGAVARHFDARNYRALRWLMLAAIPIAMVSGLVELGTRPLWTRLVWIPSLLLTLGIFVTRAGPLFERHARRLTLLYLALLALATPLSLIAVEPAYAFVGYLIPALLLAFRLDTAEYLALAGLDAGMMVWSLFRPGMPEEAAAKIGMGIASLVVIGVVVAIAMALGRRVRESFLVQWRREVGREREASRMRTELEDARHIQLSMLPLVEPALEWADVSSVSLPVSEVGGDYFDYFELAGSRLVIVIADVAGHGMASGLVMSGVRSGLNLLQEELERPVEVLHRLDRMLRDTVAGRIFVTLQIVLLDPRAGRLVVANAGHPPIFLLRGNGAVLRLGGNSLPLGTRLQGEFSQESETLAPEDLLLLFSDGVPEVRSFDGEEFGEGRLLNALRRAGAAPDADSVRDSLLDALREFRGDADQEDDLTLLTVKIGADI